MWMSPQSSGKLCGGYIPIMQRDHALQHYEGGLDVLYIDKMESTQSIRMSSHVGVRMPLHATAMGKAFLACFTEDEVRQRGIEGGRSAP